jgi:hypothetical protein
MWPDIEQGFAWVHQAAHILANHNHLSGDQVRQIYTDLLDTMSSSLVPTPASAPTPAHEQAGMLAPAINHFLKVTRSYEPGLFHCYDVPELPRTNNDLEQLFGSFRYHERRASGRKVAAPSIVVRGAARLVAATATRQQTFSVDDLAQCDEQARRTLRAALDNRRQTRVRQYRFRRDSATFLADLEQRLVKLILLS